MASGDSGDAAPESAPSASPGRRAPIWLGPSLVTLVVLVALLLAGSRHYGFNLSYFVRMNDESAARYPDRIPPGMVILTQTPGLDGKDYFLVATDPLMRGDYRITYRFRRILYPALVWLASAGRLDWMPEAMVIVNLAMIVGGTALVSVMLAARGASPWLAILYGLSLGEVSGIKNSFTNPTMMLFGLLALLLWERRRLAGASAALAAALLANESAFAFGAVVGATEMLRRRWKGMAAAAASVLPYAAVFWFYATRGGVPKVSGRVFTRPFGGIADIVQAASLDGGWIHLAVYGASPVLFFLFVVCVLALAAGRLWRERDSLAALAVFYCVFSFFLKDECWYILNIVRYLDPLFPLVLLHHASRPTVQTRFLLVASAAFSALGIAGMVIEPPHGHFVS